MDIIFLDVDGVLNSNKSFKKRYYNWKKNKIWIPRLDEENIKLLAKIIEETKAKIVLSSSWRGDFRNGIHNIKIEDSKELLKLFNKYYIEIVGVTPTLPRTNDKDEIYTSWRENEIRYYLNTHTNINNFCVIDDERFDLETFKDYLVQTNKKEGLQERDVEKAIKILRR